MADAKILVHVSPTGGIPTISVHQRCEAIGQTMVHGFGFTMSKLSRDIAGADVPLLEQRLARSAVPHRLFRTSSKFPTSLLRVAPGLHSLINNGILRGTIKRVHNWSTIL